MEELFQQERAALWTVINKQAQIVQKLYAAGKSSRCILGCDNN